MFPGLAYALLTNGWGLCRVSLGVERVILGGALMHDLAFLSDATGRFGSSTVSVLINVLRKPGGSLYGYFGRDGQQLAKPLAELTQACQIAGAGEVIVYDVDREGTRSGYDLSLYKGLNDILAVPLVALGGCGEVEHIQELIDATPVSGVAAGSVFVYAPNSHEVLLNYPHRSSAIRQRLECGWGNQ